MKLYCISKFLQYKVIHGFNVFKAQDNMDKIPDSLTAAIQMVLSLQWERIYHVLHDSTTSILMPLILGPSSYTSSLDNYTHRHKYRAQPLVPV